MTKLLEDLNLAVITGMVLALLVAYLGPVIAG